MEIFNKLKDSFTSGNFDIDNSMSIFELKKQFKAAFGCTLRVYKGKQFADGRMTIKTLDARTTAEIKKDAGKLKIKATEKVGDVEQKFKTHFGLSVQIADKLDSVLVPNEITLGEASRL
jgi:hypothetical protein